MSLQLNKSILIVTLLLLTACDNICFDIKEAPMWTDYFYANRTEHKITGDIKMVVSPCDSELLQVNQTTVSEEIEKKKCSNKCEVDGQKWECAKNKCCEESIVEGIKMGVCK